MNSLIYWNERYKKGETSGKGSYNDYAKFKAKIINDILKNNNINNVIDFGCGDGNQLNLYDLDQIEYHAYDVSKSLINKLRIQYPLYKFYYYEDKMLIPSCDLTMSIDVIYHLVEEDIYQNYLKLLFEKSNNYVLIYSTNYDHDPKNHIKHRIFTKDIEENIVNFKLINQVKNEYNINADFFLYKKK
jgi:hypothetical protein